MLVERSQSVSGTRLSNSMSQIVLVRRVLINTTPAPLRGARQVATLTAEGSNALNHCCEFFWRIPFFVRVGMSVISPSTLQ